MNFVVLLQKLGISLTKVLPLKITDKIAAGIGLLYCYMSKKKRGYIKKNLQYIFSDQNIEPELLNFYLKQTFINFSRAMVDFFRLGFISKEGFSTERVGFENIDKALQFKRGCILITLHLGNWDYAGSYLAACGVRMSALAEVTETEMFDLYTKHRERLGMKTFPVTRAGYAFLYAIKSNYILAVLADRDIMKNGVTMNFFSGRRKIPKGLAEIIIKRKIPVLFAYMVLNPPHKMHRYFSMIEPPIVFDGNADEFNRLMVKKFEGYIRQYPDQWFVFHDEWIEEGANT
ncbi:Phosphatidylinositol mannoside acyltransferase [subsurface metagenome]